MYKIKHNNCSIVEKNYNKALYYIMNILLAQNGLKSYSFIELRNIFKETETTSWTNGKIKIMLEYNNAEKINNFVYTRDVYFQLMSEIEKNKNNT